ncbi:alpha/beta hydrolase [Bifidobacterium animalis subsp. animalis]|uniref:hypothetical protein n=1 Tax=Bifidobacterium animalis TaxID=28025 RepID=UPI0010EC38ED|nr:hypothetical protein [Bifidobacterium animalis]RYN14917.1 alpha/beta hydrolase [Bifidobacterium animalis subsp. animalis]
MADPILRYINVPRSEPPPSVDAAHAMFFDDKYENAKAASESGMHGVQFLSADQAMQAILG